MLLQIKMCCERFEPRGAYHLTENFGNAGWKVNGKVTFRNFQPKIEEYVLRQSLHSGWYEPNRMLLTIYQFRGSRLTLHKFAPFLNSNRNGCGISAVNW